MHIELTNSKRNSEWKSFTQQSTYATPLKDLSSFVRTILDPFLVQDASIELETIVFEPRELISYLASQGIVTDEAGLTQTHITTTGRKSTEGVLEATFADWIDFYFIPTQVSFVIYADHDEYTTFFTRTDAELSTLTTALDVHGFKQIFGWKRHPLENLRQTHA